MKTAERLGYVLVGALGVLMGSSAYIVYKNTVTGFPVAASFFWMVCIGILAAFILPRDLKLLSQPGLSFKNGFTSLYRTPSIEGGVIRAFRRYGIWRTALNATMYTMSFVCILTALQSGQPGVVITLLVMGQLQPILSAILGHLFLGDRVNRWPMYCLGAGTTLVGVTLYRYQMFVSQHIPAFDRVMVLALTILALNTRNVIDAGFRRRLNISQTDAVTVLMLSSTPIGFIWAMVEAGYGTFPIPNLSQGLGLVYLGVVPTVFGLVLQNIARDKLGVATSESIGNMRPAFALALGVIPLSWFTLRHDAFNWVNYAGIALSIVGIIIVILFARGEVRSVKAS